MKKYFITGLLVLVPLVITFWVLSSLIQTMDQSLLLLPEQWQPEQLFGFSMVGLGAILTVAVVFVTGLIATNIFGQQLILWWEAVLSRVPVVKSIYASVKQVSDTIFSDSGNAFRKALLVEFPRKGSWTIAFLTGEPGGDVSNHLQGDYVSIYVPTTPNPTGGYFLMMQRNEVVELDMSVDQALKYIISMGTAVPEIKSAMQAK
ncbi:MAG: DUF502 domain-containing protein [Methylophilaceae bacterium]|nr:DUF502 domain-containing protein [Methylophilaceae bacterium]MDG1821368.1 DUF502 domain-containing protein [Methylophilaceae bacterium]MDG2293170.1 DUF502 domain-containing protein [Methylophilaceae bacterium]